MLINEMNLIEQIASDTVLEEAYTWVCERRKDYGPQDDVWDLRRHWAACKSRVQQTLLAGEYEFGPLTEIRLPDGETRQLWCAQDALVLKAMTIVVGDCLEPTLSDRCFHLKGHGGAKAVVRETLEQLGPQVFVMKSDVKGFGSVLRAFYG